MSDTETSEKFCIIGAGPCGLTVAKNFQQAGIAFDCYEREDDVGGNWYFGRSSSRCYESAHLISSKRLTEFTDFRMPREFPPYPSHRQVHEYLRSYARQFGLYDRITFGHSIDRVERPPSGDPAAGWDVWLAGRDAPRRYRGVVVANGHHWDPKWPQYPGEFAGEVMHSAQYKSVEQLKGRRVLIVGAGNSGCDIAVEAAQHAKAALHSLRRGYHFLPKFLFGRPIDVCGERLHKMHLPLWLRRWTTGLVVWAAQGRPQRYGLPAPDHKLFETHPIVNSQLLYWAGHGDLRFKGDIECLDGDVVRFVDGSREPIDLVIYATGYKLSFPFLDQQHLAWQDERPRLFLNAFHPQYDDLFVAGLIQPDSGIWGLADLQAQLMARYVLSQERDPPRARWFRELKKGAATDLGHGIHYIDTPRHAIEVEHYHYRRQLKRLIQRFKKPGRSNTN
ncbi:MAG: NAD(P)-binding domain-containing protein [Pirellulaceae bacterium]